MTWTPGRDRIQTLLAAGELERVAPDDRVAQRLLADAGRHLATAAAGLDADDFAGAYQLAYDALRKSAASLLAVRGLRATSRGGHIAVQEAVAAQFGTTVGVPVVRPDPPLAQHLRIPGQRHRRPHPRGRPRRTADSGHSPGRRHHDPRPERARTLAKVLTTVAGSASTSTVHPE